MKIKAESNKHWCRVSVIDNGIGINKEDQRRIFEPFYQLEDSPATTREPGTGLGLALAKQIIESYGGKLWVKSEYGRGSQFIFTLPIVKTLRPREVSQE